MEKVDIVIIGAGVVGLAIANQVSRPDKKIILVEKYPAFGQEVSSHNSEIIHAGIYSPKDSLKARLCVEGNRRLYQFCAQNNIPHKRLGKLIVATDSEEERELERLLKQGRNNGADLRLIDKSEIEKLEPNIQATSAIYSPSTGILDSHQLMKKLESLAKDKGVIFAYNCEVVAIEKKETYQVIVRDVDGEELKISARSIVNSAGLSADKIAQMPGIDIEKCGYKLQYNKGEYFRVAASKSNLVSHLIYPTPQETSLGIHTVPDLQGQLKLGPNTFYVDKIDYDVDPKHKDEFYEKTKKFLPFIELDDLSPDMAGIRAKLQRPGGPERDFIISDEKEKGFPGLINLIGIESPGLTACLAIAKYVNNI